MEHVTDEELLDFFRRSGRSVHETNELFDALPEHAHADIVRTLEKLEHGRQLVVRFTDSGTDRVALTERGAQVAGLAVSVELENRRSEPWVPVVDLSSRVASGGREYRVSIDGLRRADGTWAGRIRFKSSSDLRTTGQETSQPNRDALLYWASGLERVYLDGAFQRAS